MPADDARRDQVALDGRERHEHRRRQKRRRQRRQRDDASTNSRSDDDRRPDIGNEIEQRRHRAPQNRIGQADDERDQGRRQPDADIHHADDLDVSREALLDLVQDLQRAQPVVLALELQHQELPLTVAGQQQKEQHAEEQHELTDRGRPPFQHLRQNRAGRKFELRRIGRRSEDGRQRNLQFTPSGDRLLEELGLGLERRGDLGPARGPAGHHAAEHHQADIERHQHRADDDRGKDRTRDAQTRCVDGQRAEHDAHDDGRDDRSDQRARKIEKRNQQQREDAGDEEGLLAVPERPFTGSTLAATFVPPCRRRAISPGGDRCSKCPWALKRRQAAAGPRDFGDAPTSRCCDDLDCASTSLRRGKSSIGFRAWRAAVEPSQQRTAFRGVPSRRTPDDGKSRIPRPIGGPHRHRAARRQWPVGRRAEQVFLGLRASGRTLVGDASRISHRRGDRPDLGGDRRSSTTAIPGSSSSTPARPSSPS